MTDRQSTHSHDCCGCGPKHYEYEVWQDGVLQAGGREADYASAQSEANHYAAMYTLDGPVEVRIYEKRLISTTQQPAEPVKHKRQYAQGTALGEFGIIPMCDQVDDETVKVPIYDLAHEIWAAAQLFPGEGIEDAVERVAALLAIPTQHQEPTT